jgi:hypothetical protein
MWILRDIRTLFIIHGDSEERLESHALQRKWQAAFPPRAAASIAFYNFNVQIALIIPNFDSSTQ